MKIMQMRNDLWSRVADWNNLYTGVCDENDGKETPEARAFARCAKELQEVLGRYPNTTSRKVRLHADHR